MLDRQTHDMKTPRDKYLHDPAYKSLVDYLQHLIYKAEFTPSELREACMIASINYEMIHIGYRRISVSVEGAIKILEDEFLNKNTRDG